MKNTCKRRLAAALALVLVFGLTVTAFADESSGTQTPGQGSGSLGGDSDPGDPTPPSHPSVSTKRVTFHPVTGCTLKAPSGTGTGSDGTVTVTCSNGMVLANRIPEAVPADEYYQFAGWAVEDSDGTFQIIDLETYRFTAALTDVYAVCEDTWPVYQDMNPNRTDWYYQYVRDLSVAGVVDGYPGGVFMPNGNVTWGEALKLILLAVGYEEQPRTGAHWASGYLTAAENDNLLAGAVVTDLNAPITRLEYGRVAALAMGLAPSDRETPFADTEDELILALYDAGIVEGSKDENGQWLYKPHDNIRRSELSAVIWRINHQRQA